MSLKVSDLIKELQKLDPDMPIFQGDYYYEVREGIIPVEHINWLFEIGPIQYYEGVNDDKPYLYFD